MQKPKRKLASPQPLTQVAGEALAGRVVKGLRGTLPINAAMYIQDLGGNAIRYATKDNLINKDKIPLTEKDLTSEEINSLSSTIKDRKKPNSIGYIDYKDNDFDGPIDAMSKVGARLNTTLGQARVKETPSDYTVSDTFDFNQPTNGTIGENEKGAIKGEHSGYRVYNSLRGIANELGSKDGEGIPVNIKVKKKLAMGGTPFQMAGQMVNTVDGADGKTSPEGSILGGTLNGAAQGAQFGPYGAAAGAVIGMGVSAFAYDKQMKAQQKAEQQQVDYMTNEKAKQSQNLLANYPSTGVSSGFYASGGTLNPKYEVEQGEVVQGQPLLEQGQQVASDMHVVGGERHEQGGTDGVGGERVYSDRLKVERGGKTFAHHATKLAKDKGKFEEKLNSNSVAAKNTANRMIPSIDEKLDDLFYTQEDMKQRKLATKVMAYGGVPGQGVEPGVSPIDGKPLPNYGKNMAGKPKGWDTFDPAAQLKAVDTQAPILGNTLPYRKFTRATAPQPIAAPMTAQPIQENPPFAGMGFDDFKKNLKIVSNGYQNGNYNVSAYYGNNEADRFDMPIATKDRIATTNGESAALADKRFTDHNALYKMYQDKINATQRGVNKTNYQAGYAKQYARGGVLPGELNLDQLQPGYSDQLKVSQLANRQQAVGQVVAQNPIGMGTGQGSLSSSSWQDKLGQGAPFVDNAVNALMTANTPQLAKPVYSDAVNLDTEYNINPQLNELRGNVHNTYNSIDANNSSSGTANANKQQVFASSVGAANNLYGEKANREAEMRNKETLINSSIQRDNNEKRYAYATGETQRRAGIQSDIAANASNLASDLYTRGRDNAMDSRDVENTKMIMAMNPDSVQYLDVKQYQDTLKRNPQLLQRVLGMLPESNPNRQRLLALQGK